MKLWRDYGLSMVLFALFLLSWTGQAVTQWQEEQSVHEQHGTTLTMHEFLPSFWSATFENWQSEFLQLLSFVTLTTYLIHKGSPESRDSDDEMMERIKRIEKAVART